MNKNKGQKDKIDNSKHIQVFEHYLPLFFSTYFIMRVAKVARQKKTR